MNPHVIPILDQKQLKGKENCTCVHRSIIYDRQVARAMTNEYIDTRSGTQVLEYYPALKARESELCHNTDGS